MREPAPAGYSHARCPKTAAALAAGARCRASRPKTAAARWAQEPSVRCRAIRRMLQAEEAQPERPAAGRARRLTGAALRRPEARHAIARSELTEAVSHTPAACHASRPTVPAAPG